MSRSVQFSICVVQCRVFTGRVGHRVCVQSGPDCVAMHDQSLRQWRQRGERVDDGFMAATAVGGTKDVRRR